MIAVLGFQELEAYSSLDLWGFQELKARFSKGQKRVDIENMWSGIYQLTKNPPIPSASTRSVQRLYKVGPPTSSNTDE